MSIRTIQRLLTIVITTLTMMMTFNTYAEESTHYQIPAGELGQVLAQFGAESGLLLSFDPSLTQNKSSSGLTGSFTVEQGLTTLLKGSGINWRFTQSNSVALQAIENTELMMLETINVESIVYGEKLSRSYKDTFTSVGVVTQDDMDDYHIDDLFDSFNQLANVSLFSSNQGNNGLQIRGLNADGVTQPSNFAPLIAVIIDGVNQSAEGLKRGSRSTWDIKQVEVLRGPQSTLQGRNALAGAVIIESNDPTYHTEINTKVGFDNQGGKKAAFAVSGALIEDQVAARLSGEYSNQEKDIEFADTGNQALAEDRFKNLRGKLLIEPEAIDELSILLTASHSFDNPTAISAPVTGPDFFARKFDTASTFTELREMHVNNYAADLSYPLSDSMTLRSITAKNETNLAINSAPSSLYYLRKDNRRDNDFTQELRLEIDQDEGNLSGVMGLFYGDFNQKTNSLINVFGTVYQDGIFKNETNTKALYADLRYRLFENVSLIAGARYQKDKVRNLIDITSAFGVTQSDRETSYNVFLPKYGLAFDIDDNQTLAFTASRGYRQGFAELVAGTANQINDVDPEFMWAYELAYRLMPDDQSFQLGVNLFYNDYTDQQITLTDSNFSPLVNTHNSGESTSYGAEIEGSYDFKNGLNVFASIGLLKTKIGDLKDNICASSGGNCKGNEYPGAPSLNVALGGVYKAQSGFFASINTDYTGSYYTYQDINNSSTYQLDSRFITNTSIGYEFNNIRASLYGKNIFDKEYLTSISTSGSEGYIGDERTIGIEVLMRY